MVDQEDTPVSRGMAPWWCGAVAGTEGERLGWDLLLVSVYD
jgi:hypothetical protein